MSPDVALPVGAEAAGEPIARLRAAVATIQHILLAVPGLAVLPDPAEELVSSSQTLVWYNLVLTGPGVRRAHLEWLEVPGRLAVLHVCIFPAADRAAPIFGLDVVCGSARATGAFLDLSPVVAAPGFPDLPRLAGPLGLDFPFHRPRPAWGDIFSDDFLAIRPRDGADVERVLAVGHRVLDGYLSALLTSRQDPAQTGAAMHAQARYCDRQRENEHTLRMLASLIGQERAIVFIRNDLFPYTNQK